MREVIVDTSCLIIFSKLGRLSILKETFGHLLTTDEVVAEYGQVPEWIEVTAAYSPELFTRINRDLGSGESSCIALAAGKIKPILIIDDRQAKKGAEHLGIECIGSLGTLLIAKRKGVIDRISPLLIEIQATDFRVSNQILETIRKLADEA